MKNKTPYVVIGSIIAVLLCCIGSMALYIFDHQSPAAPQPTHTFAPTIVPTDAPTITPTIAAVVASISLTEYRSRASLYLSQVASASSDWGALFTEAGKDISLLNNLYWRSQVYDCLDRELFATHELALLPPPAGYEHINSLFVEAYQNMLKINNLVRYGVENAEPFAIYQAIPLVNRNTEIYIQAGNEANTLGAQ